MFFKGETFCLETGISLPRLLSISLRGETKSATKLLTETACSYVASSNTSTLDRDFKTVARRNKPASTCNAYSELSLVAFLSPKATKSSSNLMYIKPC